MYSLQHVFNECLADRSKNLAPSAKLAIYEDSWRSLNDWIESRLIKRKVSLALRNCPNLPTILIYI